MEKGVSKLCEDGPLFNGCGGVKMLPCYRKVLIAQWLRDPNKTCHLTPGALFACQTWFGRAGGVLCPGLTIRYFMLFWQQWMSCSYLFLPFYYIYPTIWKMWLWKRSSWATEGDGSWSEVTTRALWCQAPAEDWVDSKITGVQAGAMAPMLRGARDGCLARGPFIVPLGLTGPYRICTYGKLRISAQLKHASITSWRHLQSPEFHWPHDI